METNKILSADWLDLLFDGRNKMYGAYDLRRTYTGRVVKAILLTGGIVSLVFTGAVLANSLKPQTAAATEKISVTLQDIPPDEIKKPEPEPETKPEPAKKAAPDIQIRTEAFTTFVMTEDPAEPAPTTDDLAGAAIGLIRSDGKDEPYIQAPDPDPDSGKGLTGKNEKPNGVFEPIEIDARFSGNWEKFLQRYLDSNVPVDHGAPEGRYTVMIQFVVDLDGTVSDIQPLTSMGYGMEQEAVRVLKKAAKWVPAVQNGRPVKAYRRQPITFEVLNQ